MTPRVAYDAAHIENGQMLNMVTLKTGATPTLHISLSNPVLLYS